jgi:hypothetical protein
MMLKPTPPYVAALASSRMFIGGGDHIKQGWVNDIASGTLQCLGVEQEAFCLTL